MNREQIVEIMSDLTDEKWGMVWVAEAATQIVALHQAEIADMHKSLKASHELAKLVSLYAKAATQLEALHRAEIDGMRDALEAIHELARTALKEQE